MDFFNFWTFAIVALIGYYLIEYKKVEQLGIKKVEKSEVDPIFVASEDLHLLLGIDKEDINDFLKQHSDDIKTFKFNGNEYYSSENIKKIFSITKKPLI